MIKTYHFYSNHSKNSNQQFGISKIFESIGNGWHDDYKKAPAWVYYHKYSTQKKCLCWDLIQNI
jgi:hypothetical protein